jgi:pseudouridine kinase
MPNERTGSYTALLDLSGEMVVSLADMDINDKLTSTIIEEKWSHIASSQAIFVDTNIPQETLAYLIKRCAKDNLPLYIDPVSSVKSKKLPQDLTGIEVILPNLEEAEEIAGMKIKSWADYAIAANIIKDRGAKSVVITLGSEGIYFSSSSDSGHMPSYKTEIIDVTGAGDALTSGILSSMVHGHELRKACQYGLATAAFSLATEQSVSPDLSLENMTAFIKENE